MTAGNGGGAGKQSAAKKVPMATANRDTGEPPTIKVLWAAIIAVATLLTGLGLGALVVALGMDSGSDDSASEREFIDLAPSKSPAPTAARPTETTIPGFGVFGVGNEVQPGTYWSQPAATGNPCYWARLSDFSGDPLEGMIENQYSHGSLYVTIAPSDVGFESHGCQVWQKVG